MELIKITPASLTPTSAAVDTIDARELHRQLGVRKYFSNGIRDRLLKYGFREGVDYLRKHL